MASDEIVWNTINNQFCSYKLKTTKDQNFCRNEYNVSGLCLRSACPLANSRYATVRSNPETGVLYLCLKEIERAHMPNKWWEKIRLSSNYATALDQINEQLQYWPKYLQHKCKQRLTRLTQVAIRTKKLEKEQARLGETIVPRLAPKVRRREETRERKALAAAKVEKAIEKELLARLTSGAYSDQPLNVDEAIWKKVLRRMESKNEAMRDEDLDDGIEEEEDEAEQEFEREEELEDGDVEYVSDIDMSDEEDLDDLEDYEGSGGSDEDDSSDSEEDEDDEELKKTLAGLKRKRDDKKPPARPAKKGAKGARVGIEYEIENEPPLREALYA